MTKENINMEAIEEQISKQQRVTDHSIREYPIAVLVEKFTSLDENEMTG